ncbi:hypothetical protein FIBSPDRAFT_934020 [Athelia psychrophila]|uniref:protein-histidine N-methyltransferase n=1 Tax=Athelia psychrophila TaxID=1759441 RepID=A0A166G6L8_9AGAM|nr:hypothetical protein FIBSPDRAFT_934020 [Fibularhizoctonia sp. CBS 109695]
MFGDDLDPEELDQETAALFAPVTKVQTDSQAAHTQEPFSEVPISKILDNLPAFFSYSPLVIPLTSASGEGPRSITLARRDLYDARFQLISEGAPGPDTDDAKQDRDRALEFLDAPSDLVPGVYEGGLKTWECSLDLVDYLNSAHHGDVVGKRVLEIGCGTAVPTLFLLHTLLSAPLSSAAPPKTEFHVQDYNASVLELVTLPNMLLTWYMSPASSTYRSTLPPPESADDDDAHPPADPTTPSNLPLPPALKDALTASLDARGIVLRFFAGSWEGFDPSTTGDGGDGAKNLQYDVVLTSETIYRSEGLAPLIGLMRAACGAPLLPPPSPSLGELVEQKLKLSPDDDNRNGEPTESTRASICLVAAKVLYFGVGGGVIDFVRAVEGPAGRGSVSTVWEKTDGVGRKVMQVNWDA